MIRPFRFDTPASAVAALLQELSPVQTESIPWHQAAGRNLAQALTTDRPSPPCTVSAMDGYAVRLQDLQTDTVAVAGQIRIGQAPPPLPPGKAMKIVTGAPVPPEADVVIPREQTIEGPDHFTLKVDRQSLRPGQSIRREGENLAAGAEVVPCGTPITPAVLASLATFGVSNPQVFRKVRVSILTTGDELVPIGAAAEPWQIRNSNGPALQTLVCGCPRLELVTCQHVPDDAARLEQELRGQLESSDVVFLSGGVSMGDYDYVPSVVEKTGARIVFHGLPIRPGKPLLTAITPRGQLVLGLPGNPLSAMTCACRFGGPTLARMSGQREMPRPGVITLSTPDTKPLDLWWYRLVKLQADGTACPVSSRGSGDVVSAARSDGFVEMPPRETGNGSWPLFRWEL